MGELMNSLDTFLQQKGIDNAYQFWKATGLPQSTAYRLYRNRNTYPDSSSVIAICETFQCQPGDFLLYSPDNPKKS